MPTTDPEKIAAIEAMGDAAREEDTAADAAVEAVQALVADRDRLLGVIEETARLSEIGSERMAKQVDRARSLCTALEKIREIADGRRHYEDGGFTALGEIRDACDQALAAAMRGQAKP